MLWFEKNGHANLIHAQQRPRVDSCRVDGRECDASNRSASFSFSDYRRQCDWVGPLLHVGADATNGEGCATCFHGSVYHCHDPRSARPCCVAMACDRRSCRHGCLRAASTLASDGMFHEFGQSRIFCLGRLGGADVSSPRRHAAQKDYRTNPTPLRTIPRARLSPGALNVWSTRISAFAPCSGVSDSRT